MKINKIITITIALFLTMIGSTFAVGINNTTTSQNVVSAGLTPDSPFYFFDKMGDDIRLNFAKLSGNQQNYNQVEKSIIDERISELKVVSQQNRLNLKNNIETKLKDRKDRIALNLENKKIQFQNDNTNEVLKQEISNIENDIKNDNNINDRLKNVETQRNNEQQNYNDRINQYNNDYNNLMRSNQNLSPQITKILSNYNNKTFHIKTNKRNVYVEVNNDNLRFINQSSNVDYNIDVNNEDNLRKMIENKNYDVNTFNSIVSMPLSLKSNLIMNFLSGNFVDNNNGYDKNGYYNNSYDNNSYDKNGYDKNGYDNNHNLRNNY